MTLTEFLLARIAEDEAEASRWKAFAWPSGDCMECGGDSGEGVPDFDPARVLAECEAKRRIVEWSSEVEAVASLERNGVAGASVSMRCGTPILQALAQPYAAHPDYRSEWRS